MTNHFADALWNCLLAAMQEIDRGWDITNSESQLSRRIAEYLTVKSRQYGLASVACEKRYRPGDPSEGRMFDLHFRFDDGIIVYAEVKCHWPTYWLQHNGSLGTYNKHLTLKKRGVGDKNKSSALDFLKLREAPPTEATHVANLLLGSYTIPPHPHAYARLPSDFDELAQALKINSSPWEMRERRAWPNPHAPYQDYFRDARLFVCDYKNTDQWWPHVQHLYS